MNIEKRIKRGNLWSFAISITQIIVCIMLILKTKNVFMSEEPLMEDIIGVCIFAILCIVMAIVCFFVQMYIGKNYGLKYLMTHVDECYEYNIAIVKKKIEKAKDEKIKAKYKLLLAYNLLSVNGDYDKELLSNIEDMKMSKNEEILYYKIRGYENYKDKNYLEALNFIDKLLEIEKLNSNKLEKACVLQRLGRIEEAEEIVETYLKSKKSYKTKVRFGLIAIINNKTLMLMAENMALGEYYYYKNDFNKAKEYFTFVVNQNINDTNKREAEKYLELCINEVSEEIENTNTDLQIDSRKNRSKKGNAAVWVTIIIAVIVIAIGMIAGTQIKKIDDSLIKSYDEFLYEIEQGIMNFEEKVTMRIKDYDPNTYSLDVVNKIMDIKPELRGNITQYKGTQLPVFMGTEITIEFDYFIGREEIIRRETLVNDKVEEIVSTLITAGMKEYEKEKVLHDYLINNCKYDTSTEVLEDLPKEVFTAYGALINKSAVCQGYALALDKLLKAANIETQIVLGDAKSQVSEEYISHAWNLVKLDGEYYHIDTTWDDPIMEDGSDVIKYSYFNVNDSKISKTHKWKREDYPEANGTVYNFENLNYLEKDTNGNDFVILSSIDELPEAIRNDVKDMRTSVSYKVKNFDKDNNYVLDLITDAYIYYNRGGEYSVLSQTDIISNAGYITLQYSYY